MHLNTPIIPPEEGG